MRICILSDLNSFEGIGVYAQQIYQRLRQDWELDYVYLDYPSGSLILDPNGEKRVLATIKIFPSEPKPLFWKRISSKIPNYDLYHIASQNLSFLGKGRNFILTVHDLIPLFVSEGFWQQRVRKWLFSGIPYARQIMSDSNHTKQDILKTYHVLSEKISVVMLGVSEEFKPLDKNRARKQFGFQPDCKYILQVGIDKWRKNVTGSLQALKLLRQRMANVSLVRVGVSSSLTQDLIRKLRLENQVLQYKFLSTDDLVAMYNACDILLFPSFYEGFGLPVLEAMACGLPVIASDRSSLPEITADSSVTVNPDDVGEMAAKLELVLSSDRLRADLREKGLRRAGLFSWDKTAQAVAKVYQQVL